MPQETKSGTNDPIAAFLAAGEHPSLQGMVATREDEAALAAALEKAFDYRGDVTITLTDGTRVEGYVFDRRKGLGLADSLVRLLPPDREDKVAIPFDRIARLEFSGRDTAQGKSFETWVRKYVEKRLKGERASIESEPLTA